MTFSEYLAEKGITLEAQTEQAFTLRAPDKGLERSMELAVVVVGLLNGAAPGRTFEFLDGGVGWARLQEVTKGGTDGIHS